MANNSNNQAMNVNELADAMKKGAILLDTRAAELVEIGLIPGSIYIDSSIAVESLNWLHADKTYIIIAEKGEENQIISNLAKSIHIIGYLAGSFDAWKQADKRYDMIISIDLEEFELDVKHTDIKIIDVRDEMAWKVSHLKKAIHIPITQIANALTLLDKDDECLIYGHHSKESMMAVSYLRSNGYQRVKNVGANYDDIKILPLTFEKNK
jgi:rhodanese-related sulfurtransferase